MRLVLSAYPWTGRARRAALAALGVALAAAVFPAAADSLRRSADDPRWRAECSGCHVAFPPELLSAPAWHRVMATLERHYGTDASLDPVTTAAIAAFLERNAGTGKRVAPAAAPSEPVRPRANEPLPRITTSPWFVREHREVGASTLARQDIGGYANCAACHTNAERGDYSERTLRVLR